MYSLLVWVDGIEQWVHLHMHGTKNNRKNLFRAIKAFRALGIVSGTIRRYESQSALRVCSIHAIGRTN